MKQILIGIVTFLISINITLYFGATVSMLEFFIIAILIYTIDALLSPKNN